MNTDYKQFAQATLQFLARAQLTGQETDTFNVCRNFLVQIANGQLEVSQPKIEEDKPE